MKKVPEKSPKMAEYNHSKIEKKWQKLWDENQTYKTDDNSSKPKQFVLDMFPYPSGVGLHVGHPRGYIATDVYSRMKRMMGFNVLHPMGWDAFGLPAENFAIKNKVHPSVAVEKNIASFKKQLSVIGFDYDWSREIKTTDPEFYKWTQWTFLQMYKKGLAYESFEPINWCPYCKTGLANEDIESDGTCEICKTKVEKRPMRQWTLKITDYADRMLNDLDKLPKWPEGVKEAQRNWIGRSEGSDIEFAIENSDQTIKVFTTRADTLFGVTYIVLSPEHPFISSLGDRIENINEITEYSSQVKEKSDIDRTNAKKEKTGVEVKGVFAINPANQEKIPVWVADYVLPNHGTGAVMAVPAHDERDFEFAKKYNLPVKTVVEPCFLQTTEPGKIREDLPFVEREAITAIVKHWEDDKYIGLKWNNVAWETLITGGVEAGQTPVEAAMAEIKEETGYENPSFIKKLPTTHAKFFHVPKDQNRFAHFHVLYFELKNGEQGDIADAEKKTHQVKWLSPSEMEDFHLPESHRYSWECLQGKEGACTHEGILVDSGNFSGMSSDEAKKKITEFVGGKTVTNYRMKDWVFSRQRYWGEPIPMIHCEKCGVVPVPEKDLPVMLPEVAHYEPTGTGESPLAAISDWVNVACPTCGGSAKRETNTMPQWAGSSWYYLRYIDPKNSDALVDPKKEKQWMPVDIYAGADHATRHLIYARFWHKFLYDIGSVSTDEPFPRLEFLGYILAENGKKFSKREGNGIDPTDVVNQFGADAFRLYEMFIGPFEQTALWNSNGMVGTLRFVEKVWRIGARVQDSSPENEAYQSFRKTLHKTIKKVSEDTENFKFNTAISAFMILVNEMDEFEEVVADDFKKLLQILAPYAPHATEELWEKLGEKESIHVSDWPKYDPELIVDDTVTLGIQVNGKVRAEITIGTEEDEASVRAKVLAMSEIIKWTSANVPKKFIYIKGKIISIVL